MPLNMQVLAIVSGDSIVNSNEAIVFILIAEFFAGILHIDDLLDYQIEGLL